MAVPMGTRVKAAAGGTVEFAGTNGDYGNCIIIDHGNGMKTLYAHLSDLGVKKGDNVSGNTEIALSGNTGLSTGPHLHFEVIKDGEKVNPEDYLKF